MVTLKFPVYNVDRKELVKDVLPIILSSHEVCYEQIIPNAIIEEIPEDKIPQ